jgi:hypothetical protein
MKWSNAYSLCLLPLVVADSASSFYDTINKTFHDPCMKSYLRTCKLFCRGVPVNKSRYEVYKRMKRGVKSSKTYTNGHKMLVPLAGHVLHHMPFIQDHKLKLHSA